MDKKYKVFLEDPGIITVIFKFEETFQLEDAIDFENERLELCNGRDLPLLIENYSINNGTDEAKKYLVSPKGLECISASAMVFKNQFTMYVYKFFISLKPVPFPVKLFSDRDKAKEWLVSFIEK